jgi:hypothetical protein
MIVIAKRFESSSPAVASSGVAAILPSLTEALELIDGIQATVVSLVVPHDCLLQPFLLCPQHLESQGRRGLRPPELHCQWMTS